MERPLPGPDDDRPYLDSREAGKWLGDIGPDAFEALVAEHLPTVQPVYMGRYPYWAWMDVAVLAYLLARGHTRPPAEKGRKPGRESEGQEK
jgi:hypothetical protein